MLNKDLWIELHGASSNPQQGIPMCFLGLDDLQTAKMSFGFQNFFNSRISLNFALGGVHPIVTYHHPSSINFNSIRWDWKSQRLPIWSPSQNICRGNAKVKVVGLVLPFYRGLGWTSQWVQAVMRRTSSGAVINYDDATLFVKVQSMDNNWSRSWRLKTEKSLVDSILQFIFRK